MPVIANEVLAVQLRKSLNTQLNSINSKKRTTFANLDKYERQLKDQLHQFEFETYLNSVARVLTNPVIHQAIRGIDADALRSRNISSSGRRHSLFDSGRLSQGLSDEDSLTTEQFGEFPCAFSNQRPSNCLEPTHLPKFGPKENPQIKSQGINHQPLTRRRLSDARIQQKNCQQSMKKATDRFCTKKISNGLHKSRTSPDDTIRWFKAVVYSPESSEKSDNVSLSSSSSVISSKSSSSRNDEQCVSSIGKSRESGVSGRQCNPNMTGGDDQDKPVSVSHLPKKQITYRSDLMNEGKDGISYSDYKVARREKLEEFERREKDACLERDKRCGRTPIINNILVSGATAASNANNLANTESKHFSNSFSCLRQPSPCSIPTSLFSNDKHIRRRSADCLLRERLACQRLLSASKRHSMPALLSEVFTDQVGGSQNQQPTANQMNRLTSMINNCFTENVRLLAKVAHLGVPEKNRPAPNSLPIKQELRLAHITRLLSRGRVARCWTAVQPQPNSLKEPGFDQSKGLEATLAQIETKQNRVFRERTSSLDPSCFPYLPRHSSFSEDASHRIGKHRRVSHPVTPFCVANPRRLSIAADTMASRARRMSLLANSSLSAGTMSQILSSSRSPAANAIHSNRFSICNAGFDSSATNLNKSSTFITPAFNNRRKSALA